MTYDDTWSLFDKAKFAKEAGMGGCFTWSVDQVCGIARMDDASELGMCRMMGKHYRTAFLLGWGKQQNDDTVEIS